MSLKALAAGKPMGDERGIALVMALGILVVCAIMVTTVIAYTSSGQRTSYFSKARLTDRDKDEWVIPPWTGHYQFDRVSEDTSLLVRRGQRLRFVEVLAGYGGTVLDPTSAKKVTINSPEGVQALTEMVSWVGTISPTAVTTFTEEPSRQAFQNGDAIFMRNWPYAYSLGNAAGSKVAGKFDIHSIPYGGSNTVGHSCIGGWNMAINAFSKNPDASWSFIKYALGPDAQKQLAIKGSFTPALTSVYNDADVKAKQPLFTKLAPILQNALPRPVSPVYPDLSNIIQTHVHQALTKAASPSDALSALQTQLQALVSK